MQERVGLLSVVCGGAHVLDADVNTGDPLSPIRGGRVQRSDKLAAHTRSSADRRDKVVPAFSESAPARLIVFVVDILHV